MRTVALFTLIFFSQLTLSGQTRTQPKPLSNAVLSEFAKCARYEFSYGNGTFKYMAANALRQYGLELSEIYVAMEKLTSKSKYIYALLDIFASSDPERSFANLKGMGLQATSAKFISTYLQQKHQSDETQ